MQLKQAMVPVSKIFDAYSGTCIADAIQTISSNLSRDELERYARAICKVSNHEALNRKDLAVLDKIDAITHQHHGMCLKDSLVTKARLKACKKHGVQFVDRDHLVDHMNCMLPANAIKADQSIYSRALADFFIEGLGEDFAVRIKTIVQKVETQQDFDLSDLQFLSDVEEFASRELDWTIINPEVLEIIEKSCKKLGVYFQNLQKAVLH